MGAVTGLFALCWGDVGLFLGMPGSGLGNAAINAVGTPEQVAKFGKCYAAMCITEPGTGSDSANISTTAVADGDEWVLNGEKIFVTDGQRCDTLVVWATLDKSLGKAAIKSFIVEKGTPGCEVTRLEHKLGIRATATASISFNDCRIPRDNILGSPDIASDAEGRKKAFGGVMQTFDNTRPPVAAMAIGVSRAALDLSRQLLEEEGISLEFDKKPLNLSAVEAVGYSENHLLEKFARDSKILDIFEGTQQIQQLIVARRVLGKSSSELK
jgi:acyl-CoA dehydrogenase